MDDLREFIRRRFAERLRRLRKPKRRGRGLGGEPVDTAPRGPLPGLSGGAAAEMEFDQPDR